MEMNLLINPRAWFCIHWEISKHPFLAAYTTNIFHLPVEISLDVLFVFIVFYLNFDGINKQVNNKLWNMRI